MSESNSPFSKVPNPTSYPDPNRITIQQFQNYQSIEMAKIRSSMRVHKRSLPYIAGCIGLMLFCGFITNKSAQLHLLGKDNKGGSYLNLYTNHDEAHYAYNRQFQRMQVLLETKVPEVSEVSQQLLTDLGVQVPRHGASKIPKRPPHEKYY